MSTHTKQNIVNTRSHEEIEDHVRETKSELWSSKQKLVCDTHCVRFAGKDIQKTNTRR